jgi:hypothetical protein
MDLSTSSRTLDNTTIIDEDLIINNIEVVGDLTAETLTVGETALADSTITFSGATGTNILSMPDNLATALDIKEGTNSYLKFNSSNGSETIVASKLLAANAGLTASNIIVDETTINNSTIEFAGISGNNILSIPDNLANALDIKEGTNSYIKCTTTDAGESITLSKPTTVSAALTANSLIVDQVAVDASTVTFTGTSGNNILSIPDNLATALDIKEGANSYIKCTTTNAGESITLGKATTVSAALTANALTIDNVAIDASTVTFSGATGTNIIAIPDNQSSALNIAESGNSYMDFRSSNGAEKILIAKQTEISSALIANSLTVDSVGINDTTIAFNSVTTGENGIAIGDNMADSFSIAQSTNKYITCKTTNSAEAVVFGVPIESTVQPCLVIEAMDDQSMAVSGTNYLVAFTTPTTVFTQGSGITFSAGSFTIDNAGVYLVCFSGTWESNAVGTRFVMVNKSSSTASSSRYAENQMSANALVNIRQTFSAVMNVTAGQTINFWATQSSGGALLLLGQASGAQQGATQASITRLF